ncbi:MAG: alpha-ketoglutarate-dependent dioxygenase AlkB family protein [Chloroflexota bacterium]
MAALFLPAPELELHERFLTPEEGTAYFAALRSTIAWRQDAMRIAGKSINLPRLTAWYGDPGTEHTYSGILNVPEPWTPELAEIKARAEAAAGAPFNAVLLNLYRTGSDSMGWHSDDEHDMSPIIASVSLGAARTFQLRRKEPPGDTVSMRLTSGSLLVMTGSTQRHWQHRVPKEPAEDERINLTFRRVLSPPSENLSPKR